MSVSPGSGFPAPPASGAQFKLPSRGIVKPARAREVAAGRGWRALAPPAGPGRTSPTFSPRVGVPGRSWVAEGPGSEPRQGSHPHRSFVPSFTDIHHLCAPESSFPRGTSNKNGTSAPKDAALEGRGREPGP